MRHYTRDEKLKAVQLYIKYDKSPAAVRYELGYPTRNCLYRWYQEYIEHNNSFPEEKVRRSNANVKHFFTLWGCGHFLGPLILRYPHLSCCYKSLALSVLNWTQPSEGKLNSFFCVPVYIFIENLDKLLDSNISP